MSEMTVAILILMGITVLICGIMVWLGRKYRKEYDKNYKSVIAATTATRYVDNMKRF